MNITRENTGDLTAMIKVEILKEDYDEKVNKQIKDYQRKANIPGFRPGKVPFGMIKKMYGNALKADEINKLISESIASYIETEKLDVLGNPLPNSLKNEGVDFETQENFDLYFDLGFAPDIPLSLANVEGVERYFIKVNDEMLEKYIEDTRKRFGTSTNPEESGPGDMLRGQLLEVTIAGEAVENGIKKSTYIDLSQVKEGEAKNRLIGLHKADKLMIRPLELYKNAEEASRLLGIEKEKAGNESLKLEFTVVDNFHLVEAEMNPDFYHKVFPGLEIETEDDFREQVRNDAATSFTGETDKLFFRNVTDKLIKDIQFPLPDDFLKRWLLESRENKMTVDDIEKQYGMFSDSMRWQLIENKLIKDYEIRVVEDDIRNYIKSYFLRQIPLNLENDPEADKRYDSLIDTVMKNKEQVTKINDELYTARLLDVFRNNLNIEDKEITYEEFIAKASAIGEHEHFNEEEHHHDHDHEHEHDHHHNH